MLKEVKARKAGKKMILLLLMALPFLLQAQGFEIKGKVGNWSAPAKVYLFYVNGDQRIFDSTGIVDGAFTLKGSVPDVTLAWLLLDQKGIGYNQLNQSNTDYANFYLGNEKVNIVSKDSMKNMVYNGASATIDDFALYQTFINKGAVKLMALTTEFASKTPEQQADPAYQQELQQRMVEANKEALEVKKQYILKNPGSYFNLFSIEEMVNAKLDVSVVDSLFKMLPAGLRNSKRGEQLTKSIETLGNTSTGKVAPLFTLPGKDGKPVSLAGYKSKYVLLDFWASWCVPCRQENPNVVKAYNKYHLKGFEVLGVSLDDSTQKEAWLKAIETDKLNWAQASDLKGFKSEVAALYGVNAIPQNFLISLEGKIVAVNLRGEDLEKKLEELFGK